MNDKWFLESHLKFHVVLCVVVGDAEYRILMKFGSKLSSYIQDMYGSWYMFHRSIQTTLDGRVSVSWKSCVNQIDHNKAKVWNILIMQH